VKTIPILLVLTLAVAGCQSAAAQISTNVGSLYDQPHHTKSTNSGSLYDLPRRSITGVSYKFDASERVDLFNGTNFDGFTFCMRNDVDPMLTWSVTNGVIHCNGSAIGYLRTKQSYSNYVVTVEWRFLGVTPKKNNTGVLVHMQAPPDKVWPPCIQNQGKSGRQGDLIFMSGAESKEHLALHKDANAPVPLQGDPNENAVGEWNTNVTICVGNDVKAVINGKLLNEGTECTLTSGAIGIQSENADFEIRKMYLKPLPINPPR
jgi:hypothetical protein